MKKVITNLSTLILVSILTSGLVFNYNFINAQSVTSKDNFKTEVPKPNHVVIVIFENHSFEQIINKSQETNYFNELANGSSSALFTNSHGMTHPSQPNYLFLFSGRDQHVKDDEMPKDKFKTPNLAASLLSIDSSFKTYSEDLPYVGFDGKKDDTDDHKYVRKHNPAANWMWDKNSGSSHENQIPDSLNQPFSVFKSMSENSDFSKLPTVSFVIPNLENDMHGGNWWETFKHLSHEEDKEAQQTGNNWLRQNIKPYADWAIKNNSLLIITFDEDNYLPLPFAKHTKNQIPTIFVGQMVKPDKYSERITHCNVLATLLKMYNLSPGIMGKANSDSDCIKDCWNN